LRATDAMDGIPIHLANHVSLRARDSVPSWGLNGSGEGEQEGGDPTLSGTSCSPPCAPPMRWMEYHSLWHLEHSMVQELGAVVGPKWGLQITGWRRPHFTYRLEGPNLELLLDPYSYCGEGVVSSAPLACHPLFRPHDGTLSRARRLTWFARWIGTPPVCRSSIPINTIMRMPS